jgi:alpha-aminoadipic semialdehyde synthase
MYWDSKYPRLITKQQMKEHMDAGASKFIGVADITCDLQGSVEFLDHITSIQNPFFVYDPDTDSSYSDLASPGVLMMGVDNLPSELPLDASAHFGQQLLPFLKVLSESDGSLPFAQQNDLPLPLKHAVITAGGALTPNFAYIQSLRDSRASSSAAASGSSSASSQLIRIRGHLFDTGLINRVIDLCEEFDVSARLVQVVPGKNRRENNSMSVAVLEIRASTDSGVAEIVQRIEKLCARFHLASATIQHVPTQIKNDLERTSALAPPRLSGPHSSAKATTQDSSSTPAAAAAAAAASAVHPSRRVLVLGSGYVSGPCVRYLCRDPRNEVVVLSADGAQAAALVAGIPNASAAALDASDIEKLAHHIRGSDIVVSLLPATMHGPVAAACVREKRHMVTAALQLHAQLPRSRITRALAGHCQLCVACHPRAARCSCSSRHLHHERSWRRPRSSDRPLQLFLQLSSLSPSFPHPQASTTCQRCV